MPALIGSLLSIKQRAHLVGISGLGRQPAGEGGKPMQCAGLHRDLLLENTNIAFE